MIVVPWVLLMVGVATAVIFCTLKRDAFSFYKQSSGIEYHAFPSLVVFIKNDKRQTKAASVPKVQCKHV